MTAPRFLFDGQEITVAQLSKKFTCYSDSWLVKALKAGCQNVHDLSRFAAKGAARELTAARQGRKTTQKRHPLNCRNEA